METEGTHTSTLRMQMGRKQDKSKTREGNEKGKFDSDAVLL